MAMQRTLETSQESLQGAFVALAANSRKERRLYYSITWLVAAMIIGSILLGVYLTARDYIDRRHEQLLRHVAEIDKIIQHDEVFVRRMRFTLDYTWPRQPQETNGFDNVVQTLATSDSAVADTMLRDTQYTILLPAATRAALGEQWPNRARVLSRISIAAISTLEAMGIDRQAYVIGLDQEFAALFPKHPYTLRSPKQPPLSVNEIISTMRRDTMQSSTFEDKQHGIRWVGPYYDSVRGAMILSCVGIMDEGNKPSLLYGSDVPVNDFLTRLGLDTAQEPGVLGLLNSQGVLIDQMGSGTKLHNITLAELKSMARTWPQFTRNGLVIVEPVHGVFGYLVSSLRYDAFLGAIAKPLGWVLGIGCLLLVALFGTVRYWDKRLLTKNHQEAQRALENETLNHILISATPVGLCIVRRQDYSVIAANLMAASLFGVRGPLVLPPHVIEELKNREQNQASALATVSQFNVPRLPGEAPSPDQPDQPNYLQITYAPADYQGQPVLFCAISDVTLQKTAELELVHAREESDRLLRARSNFFASMSHEIRTPLNAVLGNLELLSTAGLPEKEQQRIGALRSASDSLLQIINDILDFSKIDAGEMQLARQTFQPLLRFEQLADVYAPIAAAKNLDFYVALAPSLEQMSVGDINRIGQIVNNLLSNAFKFTHSGKVSLNARLQRTSAGAGELQFEVSDSGIGMDAKLVARLFTPFAQAEATTAREYGGSGLGLSICATLCKLMGGEINANSIRHVGSAFSVRIPVELATSADAPAPAPQGNALVLARALEHAQTVGAWLAHWGWNVTTLHQANTNLSDLPAAGIDVLVLCDDLTVPDGNYPAPVVHVRRNGPPSPTRQADGSVIVTAFQAASLRRALAMGVTKTDEAHTSEIQHGASSTGTAITQPTHALTILVAEDNDLNRSLLADQIATLGHRAITARSGNEALAISGGMPVDLVLTDLDMPGMSGYQLLDALHGRNPQLRVVAISASSFDTDIEQGLAYGFYDYVGKPASRNRLAQLFNRVLAERASDERPANDNVLSVDDGDDADAPSPHWPAFVAYTQNELQALDTLILQRDLAELKRWAHKMRGSLLIVKQQALAEDCLELEQSCGYAHDWDEDFATLAAELGTRIQEAIAA
ncbi:hybrid sensor histidine kinase/response regulator [Andreprevotia chitinilytica]|uniref:hybrid sensor histidine kinase/response regulator n=1 Tax=Andreprevotia chitinilytica TaxID=396808 RepID=UPI00054EBCC1|nr:hybrid sensor histidine kinase/response regulator [Andreprevotia chitinilytica]